MVFLGVYTQISALEKHSNQVIELEKQRNFCPLHQKKQYDDREIATYLLGVRISCAPIVHPVVIKYIEDGRKWYGEEDTESTSESTTDECHDEDIER